MRWLHVFALAFLLLAGCAKVAQQAGITEHEMPVSGKGQLLQGTNVRASGFLRDYSEMAPVKGVTGEWEYVRKGVDWKPYTKIMLRPMEVWVNPGADYPAIQPDLYKKIEDTIRQIVTKEFEAGGYQVVDKPGPGVLVFHYALTGVTPVRQGLLPSDALPLKAAITAVRYATGTEAYYVALSGELEVLDGESGERVFAVVGARRSFATELKGDEITWDEMQDTVTHFAKQWRARLDRGRGVTHG
jgi:hypothetical protein